MTMRCRFQVLVWCRPIHGFCLAGLLHDRWIAKPGIHLLPSPSENRWPCDRHQTVSFRKTSLREAHAWCVPSASHNSLLCSMQFSVQALSDHVKSGTVHACLFEPFWLCACEILM